MVAISAEKTNAIQAIFSRSKAVIGVIHCDPFPGAPKYRGKSVSDIIERALRDTGDSATMAEIDEIRAATELPLLVGSGVTPANVRQILGRTQGVIVASTMKVDGVWWNDVELARVKHFMSVAQAALEEA